MAEETIQELQITSMENGAGLPAPKDVVRFGADAAKELIGLVKQNNWAIPIQGNDYLKFEAWQTVGRFFGYTIKTTETKFVEYGEAKGFEAKVVVLDKEGKEIGGAEGVCLNDEKNWQSKPLYALKSMAQTRAGGRALRQVLSWVVVLAGYRPTPAEEMDGVEPMPTTPIPQPTVKAESSDGKPHMDYCPRGYDHNELRMFTVNKEGANKGKKFVTCDTKTGGCGFFKFLDTQPKSEIAKEIEESFDGEIVEDETDGWERK